MDTNETQAVQEIDYAELQALIARVEHAIEHGLALEAEDMRLLLSAIHTLLEVQTQLEEKNITLHKLRKLLGMIKSSEKRAHSTKTDDRDEKECKRNKPKKPRKKKRKVEPKEVIYHQLDDLKKGDSCTQCPNGRFRKYDAKILIRISGASPFEAKKHVVERFKCDLCNYVVSVDLPAVVTEDGSIDQRYGYSARSVMAIFKHFSGMPYFHQETLNDLFGYPITASTIYDQCEYLSNDCIPLYHQIKRIAANAVLFYIDDTPNRIIEQKSEQRPNRNGKGTRLRTGIYTSGLIAVTDTGEHIYLYNTNLGHAGEFLDHILKQRDPHLPAPIIMSDALSSNLPTVIQNFVNALCNAHARRQFVDIESNFPEEVEFILDLYGQIWCYDTNSKERNDDAEQRLAHHKEHSLPVMEQIQSWSEVQINSPDCEQHGSLIKACNYFLKHYEELTQFCKTLGAPIDNNIMEEGLKIKIRSRKTSHFYKTQTGADVANVLTSIIATAYRNDSNPYEYLNKIQRNKEAVKAKPIDWLPWQNINDTS